jgi:hypothetical protein
MLRKMMLLATAVTALAAFGAQGASANWFHEDKPLVAGQNPHITATGTVQFTSSGGGVHCPSAHTTIQLTGGTTDAHVKSFSVPAPATCEVSGGLVFLTGGTTTLKTVTLTGEPTGTRTGDDLQVTNVSLHNEFTNGFKLSLTSETAPLTGTVDKTTVVSTITLEGKLNSTLAAGPVTVHGHLNVHNPTYGITAS